MMMIGCSVKTFCFLVIFIIACSSVCRASDGDEDVEMLEEILDMLKTLRLASNERHWKINGMTEDVKCMQDDYVKLKTQVELIKASNDGGRHRGGRRGCRDVDGICKRDRPEHYDICEEHSEETDEALDDIEICVDEVQDTLDNVVGISHPCDGPGWHQVIYFDMNDPNTDCPGGSSETFDLGQTRRACIVGTNDSLRTESVTVPVNEEYSQVCGRVHGYSSGNPGGFSHYYDNIDTISITGPSDSDFFASGVTLYRELDDEHIWSFIAAIPFSPSLPTISNEWCPCDVGEIEFFDALGDLPTFLGTDYFCDYTTVDKATDTPLWDGLNCVDGSECCDYGTPPYFQKVLPLSYGNIVVKLSVEPSIDSGEIGIYFMEIYVR